MSVHQVGGHVRALGPPTCPCTWCTMFSSRLTIESESTVTTLGYQGSVGPSLLEWAGSFGFSFPARTTT
jgi:hypothetical protein